MSVKNRLRIFIEDQKITIKAFEEGIKASNGYVNSISKSIGIDKLKLIIEIYPNLDIEWLLTGEGDMLKKAKEKPPEKESYVVDIQKELIQMKNKEIAELKKEVSQLKKELHTLGIGKKLSGANG